MRKIVFILILGSCTIAEAQDDFWEPTNGPYGGTVLRIAINSSGDLFASSCGGLYRSIDNGENWIKISSRTWISILAINSNGDIFTEADSLGIARSTDYGETWTELNNGLPSDAEVISIAVNSSGHLFAGTWGRGVYKSIDNGDSWSESNYGISDRAVGMIAINSDGDVFVGTDGPGPLFRSTDNGNSWTELSNGLPNEGAGWWIGINTVNGDIFASDVHTTGNGLYRSVDNGDSWTNLNDSISGPFSFNSSGHIFACGDGDGVFRSADNGETWVEINNGLRYSGVLALAINSSDDLFVSTCEWWGAYFSASPFGDGIHRSTDNGESWTHVNNGLTDARIQSIAINSSGDIFASEMQGACIYRLMHNSESWTKVNSSLLSIPYYEPLVINATDDIFVSTSDSGLFRSSDNGESWTQLIDIANGPIAFNSLGDVFAGGNGIYRSTDNGDTWTASITGLPIGSCSVFSIAINPNDEIFAGTSDQGIYRSINNGETWAEVNTGLPSNADVPYITINTDGILFAAVSMSAAGSEQRGLYRSTDNGDHWTLLDSDLDGPSATNSSGIVFVGGDGEVFRSSDNGETWMPVEFDLFNAPVTAIAISSDGFIYVGSSLGVIRSIETTLSVKKTRIPIEYDLTQNYPNPFNPVSTIRYELPEASEVSLIVYDILGREVARLVDGYLEPGYHHTLWNGRDQAGRELPSGIYIARLCCASPDRPGLVTPPTAGQKAPEYSKAIKMVLLK